MMVSRDKIICFIPGVGPKRGSGNVRRCLAVSAELTPGFKSFFCLPESFPDLKALSPLEIKRGGEFVSDEVVPECDLIVVDNQDPHEVVSLVADIQRVSSDVPIVLLDHEGDFCCPGTFHINLRNRWQENETAKTKGCFQGLEYAIIRTEFLVLRRDVPTTPDKVCKVLLTFGGEDPSGWTIQAVDWLERFVPDTLEVDVVLGGMSRHVEVSKEIADKGERHEYTVHMYRHDIATIMAACDIGFCGGGGTLMEFSCLGKPAVALPQNDLERSFMKIFEKKGYLLEKVEDCVRQQNPYPLLELFEDTELRTKVALEGSSIIDGKGIRRVAKILQENVMR